MPSVASTYEFPCSLSSSTMAVVDRGRGKTTTKKCDRELCETSKKSKESRSGEETECCPAVYEGVVITVRVVGAPWDAPGTSYYPLFGRAFGSTITNQREPRKKEKIFVC